jgi:hypothetical protein
MLSWTARTLRFLPPFRFGIRGSPFLRPLLDERRGRDGTIISRPCSPSWALAFDGTVTVSGGPPGRVVRWTRPLLLCRVNGSADGDEVLPTRANR